MPNNPQEVPDFPGIVRWRCECAYDGTDFEGWQSQVSGNTIQDYLERRIEEIFKKKIRIHGSGRTDAGVHARQQIFHFDAAWEHSPENLLRAFRCGIPRSIQVTQVEKTDFSFHARFSAHHKRYIYQIFLGEANPFLYRYVWSMGKRALDVEKMAEASKIFLGTHDFQTLAAHPRNEPQGDTNKTIYRSEIQKDGPLITYTTEGSGYLYKMVRRMVGCLVEVGLGNIDSKEIAGLLEGKIPEHIIQTAPAQGLVLDRVFY